jgi:hypothetical protein
VLAAVGSQKIEIRSERHDASGIDRIVALIIVPFDVCEIGGAGDIGILIKLAGEPPKIGVIHEASQIAFEMSHIDRIESHQGGEQTPIRFGQAFPAKVSMCREPFLQHIQCPE